MKTEEKIDYLIAIQSELKAPKNQFNSFGKYKYRSAEDILEAVKPLLKKYNCYLTITETTQEIAGYLVLNSKVSISDGETNMSVEAQAGIIAKKEKLDEIKFKAMIKALEEGKAEVVKEKLPNYILSKSQEGIINQLIK